jgi:hypothetical protein
MCYLLGHEGWRQRVWMLERSRYGIDWRTFTGVPEIKQMDAPWKTAKDD